MYRLIVVMAFILLPLTAGAAVSNFETLVDEQGYPLDDPRYDDIRIWFENEQNGLRLYRSKSYDQAYPQLAEAARHGFKEAQHGIALMHINGHGVEKNVLVGVALLGLAAESGDRTLKREYNKGLKAIPEKFRKLVRDQTEYYKARYGMDVQGIACDRIARPGSNMKVTRCLKQPGEYQTWDWAP